MQNWNIKFDKQGQLQRCGENKQGYLNYNKQCFKQQEYPQSIYYSLFQLEFQKYTTLFQKKLKIKDLNQILKKIISEKQDNIIKTLKTNKRTIKTNDEKLTSPLLKHLFNVAYSRISLDLGINYKNLCNGLPIVIIYNETQYLLIPEDFGMKTIFYCDKSHFINTMGTILNII